MNKQTKTSGGFHIAQMVPYEVIGFGAALILWPVTGFVIAVLFALGALYITNRLLLVIRSVKKQLPTALGYSNLAISTTKQAAANTKIQPTPKPHLAQYL